MNLTNLKELTKHPGWQDYLDYLDDLKVNTLRQMMVADYREPAQFAYLNGRLVLLDQITWHFEIDVTDNGTQKPENLEQLQEVEKTYEERSRGFLSKLFSRG
jgi:hypothetical protein